MKNNKQIVRYFYEQIFTHNRIDELAEYVATDCRLRIGSECQPMGLAGMRQHIADVRHTYPDFAIEVISQYEADGYVISEIIATGTHLGEFFGIAPTGKQLSFTGIDIDKVENGKIVEHSGAINTFETLAEHNLIVANNADD